MVVHPIYIAALVPTLIVLAIVGGILFFRAPQGERSLLGLLFLIELPMCFVCTYLIRVPLNHFTDAILPPSSPGGLILRSFQAPIFEELSKLWLVLLLLRLHRIRSDNAIRIGMAIGTSFGLAEIWLLAHHIAQDASLAVHPFYHFNGFIQERLQVAPLHGIFLIAATRQIGRGTAAVALGLLTEFLLHYFLNFPIILAILDVGHLGKVTWQGILFFYVNFYWVLMLALLALFVYGKGSFSRGPKQALCPGCKEIYDRPFFRVNLSVRTSYERCTKCRKYHIIHATDLIHAASESAGSGTGQT